MPRILLPFSAALAACTPSPQEDAMRSLDPVLGSHAQGSSEARLEGQSPVASSSSKQHTNDREQADELIPEPRSGSGAAKPASTPTKDAPEEALGRRTLSTAYVRVGPGGYLTVELRDGSVVVLRDVVMRPKDYCGVQVLGGSTGTRYCGGYADIAAARLSSAPIHDNHNVAVSIR